MPLHPRKLCRPAALLCILLTLPLTGCRIQTTVSSIDSLVGDSYPDAQRYQVGPITYTAADLQAVEVYWRSGQVELTESANPALTARESGIGLTKDAAMHWLLEDGVLRIRFCASDAEIRVDPEDKYLHLSVPQGIDLSIHTTAAPIKVGPLTQSSILFSVHSGDIDLGAVIADSVDLSSHSGSIRAESIASQVFRCRTSSGSVKIAAVSAPSLTCIASSGAIALSRVASDSAQITTRSGAVNLDLPRVSVAKIQTSSGTVTLSLPTAGAELLYTTHSGALSAPAYTRKGDLYVFGSGVCQIAVETASGDLTIE